MSKLIIDTQHIDFYKTHGFLELEGLISDKGLEDLSLDLMTAKPEDRRYLSRKLLSFGKISRNRILQSLALELTSKPLLKYGLDLVITEKDKAKYKEPVYFRQLFSYTGIALGLCINISSREITRDPIDSTSTCLFPSKPGSGTFFKASKALDFSYLQPDEKQLLMIFCFTDSRYKLNPFDPFAHDVKKEGMAFGDKLSEKFHPLIYINT